MKQPEDIKTLELPVDAKRGRGRPVKADALTQAERAKRYRENKKRNPVIKCDVTENEVFKLSEKLRLSQSNLDAQNEFTRQWFTSAKRFQKEWESEMTRADALQKQNDLLVAERAAAYIEIERLRRDATLNIAKIKDLHDQLNHALDLRKAAWDEIERLKRDALQ